MSSPSYTGVRRQAAGMGHPEAGELPAMPHLWEMAERGISSPGVSPKALCQALKALRMAQAESVIMPAMGERMPMPGAKKMPGG